MDERYIALMLVLLFKQCQICSSQSPCSSNPCLNNGNCYVNTNNTYRCSCRTGYKGDRCEYPAFVKGYVSTGKPAYQSATYSSGGISYDAGLAVDGNGNQDFSIGSCSRTVVSVNQNPYWYIDLGSLHIIERVYVYTPYGYEDASNQLGSIDYLSTSYSWYPDVIGRFVFLFQKKIPTLIPVVTCPGDIDIIGTSSSRVSWDAPTVVDDVDTGLTATCTSSSGSYFPVGSTTVTCTATDSDANTGQCTFTIQLLLEDNEMPIVVCRNDISTSSSSFRQYTWNDPTVSDNIDTGLSANCTPPSGSSFNGGSVTHVTCNATDSAGNTGSCQFTLTVLDTGNPTVTCPSNIVRNSHTDQTTVTWIASVQDYGDPDLSADCIPPSGSSFRLGSTDVICTDRAGNIGICAFKITVNHNNNPYENPNVVCPDDVIRITTSDRVTVTWDDPSVTDNVDTGLSATCTPSSGSSFNIGSTDVTCFATDSVGNYGSCNLKVIVIDIDAPIVTCPFNMEEDTDGGQATVTWSDPSVTDNVDSGLSATCTPSSGSLFNIGSTDVACTAMDTDGKTGSCKFTVSVNGRDWLNVIKLNWQECFHNNYVNKLECRDALKQLLDKHEGLFKEELGLLKHIKADVLLKGDAKPMISKAYRVPYALRSDVDTELDRLVNIGVLTPVTHSQWASGIVTVRKKDGSVRLCGNYKPTINPVLQSVAPPNINVDDILSNLAGGETFTKLDLAQAYNQMELSDESKKVLTIITEKGLFQQNRLVFGITSAPAIWQNAMNVILKDLPGVQVYLDDILVTGKDDQEHLGNLERVLVRLQDYGLRLKRGKCEFMKQSVEYLGHCVDKHGVHKSIDKIDHILQMPLPSDITTLRSYLGMVNYYRSFVPRLATILAPLTSMLEKGREFKWTELARNAWVKSKEMLRHSGFLVHYDPNLPLTVATDASGEGVGAVLSHMVNGKERPIKFASRSLNKTERNYPQLEREALAIVYACKKFYSYIYGRKFILITDNKPLTTIFGPKKGLPILAAERIQRWALYLSGFDYNIKFRNSQANANADCLSRLPVEGPPRHSEISVAHIGSREILPVTSAEIRNNTRKDVILSRVMRNELTIEGGCLLWGVRVIIPPKLRQQVLEELHVGHIGVVKMKGLARSHFWWPLLDAQIEETAKKCDSCQRIQNNPTIAPMHPWLPVSNPGERVHVDFAGPFEGLAYLIVVDAFSKWPEVFIMQSTTSHKTIGVLRTLFSRNGLPQVLVSDNGPQFTSGEFKSFMAMNGISHKLSAPYHPSTNGQAERFVQSLKQGLRAARNDSGDPQTKLDRFLLSYRNAEHSLTKETPAKLFMNRSIRTRLDILRPNINDSVRNNLHKAMHKRDRKLRLYETNDLVYVRNYIGQTKWVPGVVVNQEGPLNYKIDVGNKLVWKRHVDQIKDRGVNVDFENKEGEDMDTEYVDKRVEEILSRKTKENCINDNVKSNDAIEQTKENCINDNVKSNVATKPSVLRRSTRVRKAPDRFHY
ncbi:uncharacterized protein [Antedon mediterranea]|uniref:uncharacterized protein isoform X2 n=1 Tax=Antedon mediterranea TaxID=105859 RepID=UPI003AF57907